MEFLISNILPALGIGILIYLTYALGIFFFLYNLGMILINPEKVRHFFHAEDINDVDFQYISKKMTWAGFGLFTILLGFFFKPNSNVII